MYVVYFVDRIRNFCVALVEIQEYKVKYEYSQGV